MRVDQRVDTDGDGVIETGETTWRHVEVNSHRPGALGAQLGKRAYLYANGQSTTPSSTSDYAYVYDPVGNVWVILSDMGEEVYWFSQDAFGNELSIAPFNGTLWQTARTAGITEHQTGKWIDTFTGLYYFSARWYDSGVGRFVSWDPDIRNLTYIENGAVLDFPIRLNPYVAFVCAPTVFSDPSGLVAGVDDAIVLAAMATLTAALSIAIICNADEIEQAIRQLLALLQNAVLDISESVRQSADDLISRARERLRRCNRCKRDRWWCRATCNVQQIDHNVSCPARVHGSGYGSSQAEACEVAKRIATQGTPLGCYPRHCQCKDCYKR